MSRRAVRLILVPSALFVVVTAVVLTLALTSPAKDEGGSKTVANATGSAVRGEPLFAENCSTCHGEGGTGGGVGPRLAGNDVSIDEARSTIENGSGVMPAGLVEGQELEDVLAYLETILAP